MHCTMGTTKLMDHCSHMCTLQQYNSGLHAVCSGAWPTGRREGPSTLIRSNQLDKLAEQPLRWLWLGTLILLPERFLINRNALWNNKLSTSMTYVLYTVCSECIFVVQFIVIAVAVIFLLFVHDSGALWCGAVLTVMAPVVVLYHS